MSDRSFADSLFHGRLRAPSGRLFWLGLVMVVLRIAAIVFPIISTLVATLLVGSFSIHGTGPFFGEQAAAAA
jgi:uncharacterized membrane protein HdeD (DUF308 family)